MNEVTKSIASHEGVLYKVLTQLFPSHDIHRKVKKELNIKYPFTGTLMEFDVWIPELQLCFEFQDAYHYTSIWYSHLTQAFVELKDKTKQTLALKNGLTLISVPCWWDGSVEGISSMINFARPELGSIEEDTLVSLNPIEGYFNNMKLISEIPNIGELMLVSFPLHNFEQEHNWWMGEKYDGVRYCWNPLQSQVYSRSGKEIDLSHKFICYLPQQFLDGEIWFGRGQYSTSFMLLKHSESHQWPMLRMISFDLPSHDFRGMEYEKRYDYLLSLFPPTHPFVVPTMRIEYDTNFAHFIQNIIDGGGEGVILQQKLSLYEEGRSKALLKLKIAQGDREGIVTGLTPLNSVHIKLPNGTRFLVPHNNVHIPTPSVGYVVTLSFQNNKNNNWDSMPLITRVRTDIGWDEVVNNYHKDLHLGAHSMLPTLSKGKKDKKWTAKKMKRLLMQFARRRNLDPKHPLTWIDSYKEVSQLKLGIAIIKKFGNRYLRAIQKLIPGIKFDDSTLLKFKEYWNKSRNRRKFFIEYAKKYDFDPLVPDMWYKQEKQNILALKGAKEVLYFHNQSISRALTELFPDIGLIRSKFHILWDTVESRRGFFERYAKKEGFDPLVKENWYKQPRDKISAVKQARRVVFYHHGSVATALMDLFPDIGLEKSQFKRATPEGYWQNKANRRKFFEEYAISKGFDPLNPSAWYSEPRTPIKSVQKASSVLFYYSKSVVKALLDLFPEIGLDATKFTRIKNA